jgi:type VI secretion system protein ImpC
MDDSWTPDFGQLDTSVPEWAAKRPTRIAVLGDFSGGAASGRLDTGADLARRKMIPVEFDTLEDALGRLNPTLTLPIGGDGAGVEITFGDIDSFHPDQLYQNVDVFRALSDLRKRLNNTSTFAKAAAEVNGWGGSGGKRVSRTTARRSRSGAPAAGGKLSDFARLTGIAPDLDTSVSVDKMLQRIVGPLVQKAPDPKKDKLVAAVDEALSDAMRAVLHQPDFQNLESLWRGMDMLLRRIETGPMLQVLLVDVSAEEFAADLASSSDLSETGLYQMLVEKPAQEKNGGVQLICGLYNFETTPPHAELLGRMAKIARHAGAPFVTAMAPDALMDRRNDPHELIVAALQALRELPEATHLSLLAPRFLLRHPYGKRSDPISAFSFEEFTAADGLRGMLWGHPAILAACILGAPRGTTTSIGDLPFHYMTDSDGDQVALPCTERLINVDGARRLASFGLRALMSHKGQPEIRIAGLETMGATTLALAAAGKPAPRVQMTTTTLTSKVPVKEDSAAAADGDEATASADGDSSSGDSSMDDLLAGLGGDDSSSSDAGSSDSGGDSDLDALLASLGGDDATTTDTPAEDTSSTDTGGEEEMDPELAALLKSLE